MRHNLLQKPNLQTAQSIAPRGVNDPNNPFALQNGVRRHDNMTDPFGAGSNSLTGENQFYSQIEPNLRTAVTSNARDAGVLSNTPEFQSELNTDVQAHVGEEQMSSVDRQNAIRTRLGMAPVTGGSANGIPLNNLTAQSSSPTNDVRSEATPNNSAYNTILSAPASASNNSVTMGPTNAMQNRKNAILQRGK